MGSAHTARIGVIASQSVVVLGTKGGATAHLAIAGGNVFAKDGFQVGGIFGAVVVWEIDDGAAIKIGKDAGRAIESADVVGVGVGRNHVFQFVVADFLF